MIHWQGQRRWHDGNNADDDCNKSTKQGVNLFSFSQNKDAGDSDSEKEQEELNELENLLKKHDPDFSKWVQSKTVICYMLFVS